MKAGGGIPGGTKALAAQLILSHRTEWLGLMLLAFGFEFLIASMLSTTALRENVVQFLSMMPGVFQAFLGGKNMSLMRPEGMLAFGYTHPMMQVLLSVLIFTIATRNIAGHIEHKITDLILSRAVSRHQLYVAVVIAMTIGTLMLCLVSFLGMYVACSVLSLKVTVNLVPLIRIVCNLWLLFLSGIGIALIVAVNCSQGRVALGWMIGIWVLFTIVELTSKLVPSLSFLGTYTPLHYYAPYDLLDSWYPLLSNGAVHFAIWAILSIWAWQRFVYRDI